MFYCVINVYIDYLQQVVHTMLVCQALHIVNGTILLKNVNNCHLMYVIACSTSQPPLQNVYDFLLRI